ncbi:MAG TPA: hypothetical protein VLE54_05100 [Thermoanaerobaculia bacterium]|nr:hypothetical protein [Thermoanaerobaculia bacterium]
MIVGTILFDGNVAGNISSWEQTGERLVGYWIGKEYWGRGIGNRHPGARAPCEAYARRCTR